MKTIDRYPVCVMLMLDFKCCESGAITVTWILQMVFLEKIRNSAAHAPPPPLPPLPPPFFILFFSCLHFNHISAATSLFFPSFFLLFLRVWVDGVSFVTQLGRSCRRICLNK